MAGNSVLKKTKDNNSIENFDGIKMVVDMAKSGKIDAWNIDIVDLTDKYLSEIAGLKSHNLKLTGRTLFFAAVLLKLKSDLLGNQNPLEELEEMEDFEGFGDDFEEDYNVNFNNIVSLDDALERRTSVKLNKKRPVSLKELIKHLKFYEELEKRRSLKSAHERAKKRAKDYSKFTADDIINMAHDEYIETSVEKIHQLLIKLFKTNERVELNELITSGLDKVTAYIALLFLSAKFPIELEQEEFYSDLYIVAKQTTL